jgi:hypothetical protein
MIEDIGTQYIDHLAASCHSFARNPPGAAGPSSWTVRPRAPWQNSRRRPKIPCRYARRLADLGRNRHGRRERKTRIGDQCRRTKPPFRVPPAPTMQKAQHPRFSFSLRPDRLAPRDSQFARRPKPAGMRSRSVETPPLPRDLRALRTPTSVDVLNGSSSRVF